ncbi:MAG TPA: hypothetical protein VLB10_03855 [Gammaproteobacteria bacterium]|nr:hypothetical protein [Gammaproteobacteria bacterium]
MSATATMIAPTMICMMVPGKAHFSRASMNRTIRQLAGLLDV